MGHKLMLCLALGGCLGLMAPKPALAQPSGLSVSVVKPAAGALNGDSLWICATVASTYEVSRCSAQVEGRQVDLVFTPNAYADSAWHAGWTNTLSLSGLTRGTKTLTVTVTDWLANSSQTDRSFVYDRKPVLTIAAPLAQTVARPQLHVAVSATDDDPAGSFLQVSVGAVELAIGHDSLVQDLSLAGFEGTWPTLHFLAIDSAGQRTEADVQVAVESDPRLVQVAEVPGLILEAEPTRVLFRTSLGDRTLLKIRDLPTGSDTTVVDQAGLNLLSAYLTPRGAIFSTGRIFDSRDGGLIDLGDANSPNSLAVKGNYAIWNLGQKLILRDLLAGTNAIIATNAGNWRNDVAANGEAAYWGYPGYNIFRCQAGAVTQLTTDNQLWNTYVLTDGTNIVYRKHGVPGYGLFLHDGTHEIELAPVVPRSEPIPGTGCQVNGGWAAFTRLGSGGQEQVWRRSPDGTRTQITYYADASYIDSLAANGELLYWHGARRYLSRPNQTPIEIGDTLGNFFWAQGQWWTTIGRSLFQYRLGNTFVPLNSVKFTEDGKFKFRVRGAEGQTVVVQASQDLTEWTDLVTNTLNGGSVEFFETLPAGLNRRLYRVRE